MMLMLPTEVNRTSICSTGKAEELCEIIPHIPKKLKETKQRPALVIKEEVTPFTEILEKVE